MSQSTPPRPIVGPALEQRPAEQPPTGAIAGVVVIGSGGQPLDRVELELSGAEIRGDRTVYSDDDGRFVFSGLPAGRYVLSASRDGYVDVTYGQRRPGTGASGTPIQLDAGQKISDLTLSIPKGGVITGTVFDEKGRPAIDTTVRVSRWTMANGERRLDSVESEDTDDRGRYRIFGLPPGRYLVHSEADVDDDEAREGYAPVYYPGALDVSAAQTVEIGVSEERAGIDLTLQQVPLATVAGRLMMPPGLSMNNVRIRLVGAGVDVPGVSTPSTRAGRDGAFTFRGVPPGQYRAMAVASVRDVPPSVFNLFLGGAAPAPGEDDDRLQFWAAADVTVAGQPIDGLLLAMQPGMTVSGQVVFEGTSLAPPENLRRARLTLAPALSASEAGVSSVRAELDEEGRFQFLGVVPGEYRLEVSRLTGWWPKSAMVGGRDVLDGTLTVSGRESVTGLALTMADRNSSVSGLLQNQLAQPVADYTVILAPADSRYWVPRSRRIRATRPGTDGLFTFGDLPAGEYRLAAVTDVETGRWYDPEFLEQLVPASIPLRLGEGEQRVQNIRVAGQ